MPVLGEGSVLVNGVDLSSLGLALAALPGLHQVPTRRPATVDLWGRDGGIVDPGAASARPREIVATGTLIAATPATRRLAWDALVARLDQGLLEVVFADRPGWRLMAYAVAGDLTADQFASGGRVSVTFFAPNPVFERIEPFLLVIGQTPVPVPPGGTGVLQGYLQITGATNPVLTYRNAAGEGVATMAFTVAQAAGDYLDINLQTLSITKVVSGVRSNGLALLTSPDFLILSPRDGDIVTGTGPTLEISSGTAVLLGRHTAL